MTSRDFALIVDLLAASLAIVVIGRRVLWYRTLVIDHVLLFTVGHLYYLSFALIADYTGYQSANYRAVYALFNRVDESRRLAFSVWSLGLLVAFLIGHELALRARQPRPTRLSVTPHERQLPAALVVTGVAFAFYSALTIFYRGTILGGYRSGDVAAIQGSAGRGALSAVGTAVVASALVARHLVQERWAPARANPLLVVQAQRALLGAVGFVLATLLVSGGRLYATTSVIAIVVWYSTRIRPIRRSIIIGTAVIALFALTSLGAIRTGRAPELGKLQSLGAAESILTSISLANFMLSPGDVMTPVRPPEFLATDFVNIVPRVVLPNKDDFRLRPEDRGFVLNNPLGGQSLGVSMLINFGSVGSLFVIAGLGAALTRLRRQIANRRASLAAVSYAIISASLAMSFYRDFFGISIVRWWVVTGVIIPWLVYYAIVLSTNPVRRLMTTTTANIPA